jgi:hypothetical protein
MCDTKKFAERIKKGGEFEPKGRAHVVPVIVEIREVSGKEAAAFRKRAPRGKVTRK